MPKKPPRSPQEKKALSYARDRRNRYGENDKASRKAIPLRKAGESRKVRRKAHHAVHAIGSAAPDVAELTESSLRANVERLGRWKKAADVPLKDYLLLQARRRSWRGLEPHRATRQPAEEP